MRRLLWIAIVLCMAGPGVAQISGAKSEKPIGSMAWLAGGVWTADASDMAPGMKIETRYSWADNKAYLRFTTHFVSQKGTANRYDGQFYWDANAKQLRMWYMSAEGTIFEGPISSQGDTTTFDFRGENFEGKMSDLRVNVIRKTNDLYHWQLLEKSGESWKELAGLDYKRAA